ncbi:sensor histidine kinase [Falsiroseomonas stagni]|uniref:sensor histidine kinase n=1 Tax=Falsiroseomonas stagni TaxID=484882 RepID=UPI001114350C|nr:ATP-binding protein [Falsiroseomonas stagni]
MRSPRLIGGVLAAVLIAACWAVALRVADVAERDGVAAGLARAEESSAIAQAVATNLEHQIDALHALAERWLANPDASRAPIRAELEHGIIRQMRRADSAVERYAICDPAGLVLWEFGIGAGSDGCVRPVHAAVPPSLRSSPVPPRLSMLPSAGADDQAAIQATQALIAEAGGTGGIAVAVLRLPALSAQIAAAGRLDGGVLALALDTGQLIAWSEPRSLPAGQPVAGPVLHAGLPPGHRGQARMVSPITGRDELMAWRRVMSLNLFAIGTVDAERQLAAAASIRGTAYGSASLASLLIVLALLVWSSLRDAGEARQAALARDALRGELERLIGGIPAVFILRQVQPGGESRLLYRGGDVEAVTGWPPATFQGHDSLAAWCELDVASHDAFYARVVAEGSASLRFRFRQPDGGFRHMRLHCRSLAPNEAGFVELAGYLLDVTSQVQAEARALHSARLASLGAVSAGLAHELKQPLTAISLAAEVAQVEAEQIGASAIICRLAQIVEEVDRTVHLIESLRRFARGSQAGYPIGSCAIDAVVDSAVSLMARHLRALTVDIEVDPGPPGQAVLGDPEAIKQILINFLTNAGDAVAALPRGTARRVRIAVRPDAGSGRVAVAVADNGGGIAPDILPRLFEPFVTTKPADVGTGLGLSISLGLARAMMAEIHAANVAQGAEFTLLLAAAPGPGSQHDAPPTTRRFPMRSGA